MSIPRSANRRVNSGRVVSWRSRVREWGEEGQEVESCPSTRFVVVIPICSKRSHISLVMVSCLFSSDCGCARRLGKSRLNFVALKSIHISSATNGLRVISPIQRLLHRRQTRYGPRHLCQHLYSPANTRTTSTAHVSTQHIIAPRTLPRLIPPRERQLQAKTVFNSSYQDTLSVTFTSHGRAYPVGLPYLEGYWCIQCCSSIRELACICAVRCTCSEDTVLPRLTNYTDPKVISAAAHTPQMASSLPGQTLRSMLTHSLPMEILSNSTNKSLQSHSR